MSLKDKNFETFLPHFQKKKKKEKKRFSWCTFVQLLRQYATWNLRINFTQNIVLVNLSFPYIQMRWS